MNRRSFLGLLGLLGCKDELENMNKPEKIWWLNSAGQQIDPATTNAQGQQVFGLIGDSIGRGNSDAVGSTPPAGTVYQYDAATDSIVEVGATDLIEVAAIKTPNGSPWPRFGIDYNAATGLKACFACTAIGGGHFYTAADSGNLSWYTNGPLYANSKTKIDNALAALGVTKPKGIFIIMGYNDVANSTGTTYAHVTSLIDRINTDYDTPNIYISFNNKHSAIADNVLYQVQQNMKKFIRQLSYDYANVELFMSLETLDIRGSNYQVDDAHLDFSGNEAVGACLSRQLNLSSSYHKHARFIIASFESTLSDARKTLINNFIQSQDTSGNLELIDSLYWFKGPAYNDILIDWFGLTTPVPVGSPTVTADLYLATNGSSQRVSGPCVSMSSDKSLPESDIILGARIATNTDGSGLDGAIFGTREGAATSIIDLAQTITPELSYRLSSAGVTLYGSGDDYFVNDSFHATARNGGTVYLIKNKTEVTSASVASATLASTTNATLTLGARNNNLTIDRYFAAQYIYFVMAKYSTFDLDSFYDEMETLIAGW